MNKQTENGSSAEKRFPVSFGFIFSLFGILLIVLCLYPRSYSQPGDIANEALAINSLRRLSTAQEIYKDKHGTYGSLDAAYKEIIDWDLTDKEKECLFHNSFVYKMTFDEGNSWSATAVPARPGKTAVRSFYIDETGVIRHAPCESADDPPADASSKPLGE